MKTSFKGWNTSRVKDISGMFYECKSINKPEISHFDISEMDEINELFRSRQDEDLFKEVLKVLKEYDEISSWILSECLDIS